LSTIIPFYFYSAKSLAELEKNIKQEALFVYKQFGNSYFENISEIQRAIEDLVKFIDTSHLDKHFLVESKRKLFSFMIIQLIGIPIILLSIFMGFRIDDCTTIFNLRSLYTVLIPLLMLSIEIGILIWLFHLHRKLIDKAANYNTRQY